MKTQLRTRLFAVAIAAAIVGLSLLYAQPAKAQWGFVYHPGSVHYHRVYHPTSIHWTPGLGIHTHGHYGYVPHYTRGYTGLYYGRRTGVSVRIGY